MKNNLQYVPIDFQPRHPFPYPQHNKWEFERWFFENLKPYTLTTGRKYLPIFWTAYYCLWDYGKNSKAMFKLQQLLKNLPEGKYFTICQYDDGIISDVSHLDLKVFGMSGGKIDYPIPLLCPPHRGIPERKRSYFASFIGGDTHPIRKQMVAQFKDKKDCLVTFNKYKPVEYCEVLARSVFALCPRGYGKTSFRIQEALQHGAIPVYISDEHIIPYNIDFDYGIKMNLEPDIYDYLKAFNPDSLRGKAKEILPLYTYEGCKQKILEELKNEI